MAEFGHIEDSFRQYIVEMINEIIKQDNLPFERADAQLSETEAGLGRSNRKFPDIVVWKKGRALEEGVLLLELKRSVYPPLTAEVVDDAFLKASKAGIRYFATSNMQSLVLFDAMERALLLDRRKSFHKLSDLQDPRDILRPDVRDTMKQNLRTFLRSFSDILSGISSLPKLPID